METFANAVILQFNPSIAQGKLPDIEELRIGMKLQKVLALAVNGHITFELVCSQEYLS
jgi:hypothetical protein